MVNVNQADLKAMQTLIRLVSAGARKEDVSSLSVDWNTVLPLAVEQHVIPLLACALLSSPDMDCPETIREYLLHEMRNVSASNLVRRQRILKLIDELQNEGFRIKVLKGYAIAGYYAYPEIRDAADVDLLIDPNQEKMIYRILEQKGFKVTPRSKTSHQGVCQHSKYGVVEIHAHLYDELVEDVWFQGMDENEYQAETPINLIIDECNTKTLGYTDQLVFLALHMIKHFISGGLTIRMLLDVALFFDQNSKQIDSARFWNTMDKLQYATLVHTILGLIVTHGGFDRVDFQGMKEFDRSLVDQLLLDIQCGGYMGSKEINERQDASMEYNRRLLLKRKSFPAYIMYMIKWKLRSAASHMFPEKSQLFKEYPLLLRWPVAIPFVRLYQAIEYPLRKLSTGILVHQIRSENSAISPISKARIELFEALKIV